MGYRFANNASTTLGGGISPTATTIVVATGTGTEFPALAAGQYFTATLIASGSATGTPNEIVLVTGRTGDTMTVVRGQEGTTAQSWAVGDTFANFITAGFLNQAVDSSAVQAQAGNWGLDSGTANAGAVSISPAPTLASLSQGLVIRVKKTGATNTGAYTLNVNGLGSFAVTLGQQPLQGGELAAAEWFEVMYDGGTFNLLTAPAVLQGSRIVGNTVPNAALVQMAAQTVKGNLSGGTATPYDVPLAALTAAVQLPNGSGWTTLPGGWILQWGAPTLNTGSSKTNTVFTFPRAFPNALLSITGNADQQPNSTWGPLTVSFQGPTLTQCTIQADTTEPSQPINQTVHVRYIAIGW